MLYRPEAHEALVDEEWEERRVRDGIRRIATSAAAAFDGRELWPAHEWDAFGANLPLTHLWSGAAGTVWALHVLREHAEARLDLAAAALRALEAWRERPDFVDPPHLPDLPPERDASYWMGETGILLVAWLLAPSAELAESLHVRVRENARSPTNAHGFAANTRALLQGGADAAVEQAARKGAARTAVVEDGLANWPTTEAAGLVGEDGEIRLQWCSGAGGMVESLADVLDEELLLAGAELVWRAGPPAKGPMLCHGTAGNGYALLKAFRRTGDERWLARARRFAVHALAQVEALPPRYSLSGGGVGAAVFAAACIDGDARFPTLERWE